MFAYKYTDDRLVTEVETMGSIGQAETHRADLSGPTRPQLIGLAAHFPCPRGTVQLRKAQGIRIAWNPKQVESRDGRRGRWAYTGWLAKEQRAQLHPAMGCHPRPITGGSRPAEKTKERGILRCYQLVGGTRKSSSPSPSHVTLESSRSPTAQALRAYSGLGNTRLSPAWPAAAHIMQPDLIL
ncbi:hypothetical protein BGZ61DRAFT_478126 [Ilyonectria robusta]|uniref:uncharacterized protein n=1 Tax=Ilyonectria robusta TaxID=1079257 RepID=UPI001E8DFE5F|nr:uncharacterized protein BGZ61DRAFT_478126 [Ilyonectria robusta]KAH8694519.1 hypothetical protein BGZ61DRAFT_478126 [Ilyonectria robusta]